MHEKLHKANFWSLYAANIQNFESRSPALSRSNSLRIKKDDTTSAAQEKLSTGTRLLRDHELTYFGVPSINQTKTTDSKLTKLSYNHSNLSNNSSLKSISNNSFRPSSTIIVNHQKHSTDHRQQHSLDMDKPDLIMHHHPKSKPLTPELTTFEKKSMIEALDSCINETNSLEPMYENLLGNQKVLKYDRKTDLARDEKILNELTRAADEIMNVSTVKLSCNLLCGHASQFLSSTRLIKTCKEMYHADSEEKRRKSLLGNTACLETITEGRQQRTAATELQKVYSDKVSMKSKGVQVSRNFEDSLRRYHPTPQRSKSSNILQFDRHKQFSCNL